ncbi:MAG: pyruvate kinase [Candidatus Goldbacteria bacterium]|nr:pyruvate kinase [Candidatus Goldiibacteriota bacterium]HPD18256.1 pyruvate kinase [Candidatus Goldiibacteriota bacterium]
MKKLRKTKIIATMGPGISSYSSICRLIKSGVDIFRLNFSHGDYAFFDRVIGNIKKARKKLNKPVAIMQDLQGPKIRIGKLPLEFFVKRGEVLVIRNSSKNLSKKEIYIDVKNLYKYVKTGQKILINDGVVELKVKEIKNEDIICKVIAGGEIKSRKGVNLPHIRIPIPALTQKDKRDLKFGLQNGIDAVCLSFVRDAGDLKILNKYVRGKKPVIIAKIEKPEALKQIDEILDLCDGIMVARGDLAVEAGYSIIPFAQKMLISKANKKGKIVIVATQMLESMINTPFPQRAEITDVYNAVIDGADVLMLSGETSVGKYPFKTVNVMHKIIMKAEMGKEYDCKPMETIRAGSRRLKNVISYCAVISSSKLNASIIAVKTKNIDDVSFVSDYRPQNSVVAITDDENLYNKLSLIHSVYPVLSGDDFLTEIKKIFPDVKNVIYMDFYEKNRSCSKLELYELKK